MLEPVGSRAEGVAHDGRGGGGGDLADRVGSHGGEAVAHVALELGRAHRVQVVERTVEIDHTLAQTDEAGDGLRGGLRLDVGDEVLTQHLGPLLGDLGLEGRIPVPLGAGHVEVEHVPALQALGDDLPHVEVGLDGQTQIALGLGGGDDAVEGLVTTDEQVALLTALLPVVGIDLVGEEVERVAVALAVVAAAVVLQVDVPEHGVHGVVGLELADLDRSALEVLAVTDGTEEDLRTLGVATTGDQAVEGVELVDQDLRDDAHGGGLIEDHGDRRAHRVIVAVAALATDQITIGIENLEVVVRSGLHLALLDVDGVLERAGSGGLSGRSGGRVTGGGICSHAHWHLSFFSDPTKGRVVW